MELDRKKFNIQILIAVIISLLFHLIIDPYFYFPFLKDNFPIPDFLDEESFSITTLSLWIFSFSVVFFYYPDNFIINNFLVSSLVPLLFVVITEFLSSFFLDIFHIFGLFY